MRCFWRLWPWAKRTKPHDEEDSSLLSERPTIVHTWDSALKIDPPESEHESNLEERYVRFGIGGAGNKRKLGFPFHCYSWFS